jgi:hypothetical protein
MTIYGELPTSYFSTPAPSLDPKLFENRSLRSWVRSGVLSVLRGFLNRNYRHSELWAHPWLAGSAVSYQWQAAREPGDLDCLIGVDFTGFRKANPEYRGLTDREIADQLNEEFREQLHDETENWNGFELTFYVNPAATDIRSIKPYAAYDLKYNEWTVTPDPQQAAPSNPEWDSVAESDKNTASTAATRFTAAVQDMGLATSEAVRRNAEVRMTAAMQQANALYNDIHSNRSLAFSPEGAGYADFHNYRWQAGKRAGTIEQLRTMRQQMKASLQNKNPYGVDLPDHSTLVRRAALYGKRPQ